MSCRPRGPSDRPLDQYGYDALELGCGSNAPRLPQQSVASRLLLASFCVVCACGFVALALLVGVSLLANLAHAPLSTVALRPSDTFASVERRDGSEISSTLSPPLPPWPPWPPSRPASEHTAQVVRTVRARLAAFKDAILSETGADEDAMRFAFPHWFDAAGALVPSRALHDMALTLSYLAHEDARDGDA